ncbi:sensor histidine kinase [Amaricoccus solimangrovi]|uniref:histidine kinase n=1 Tax=Amaricoccus solimangrovi TaxID=2589815 RepID=A0A501WCB6_9RHOB|nr:ATP-binding protein [Amaricoccus solimangrovi]TPE47573.1 hypothetical protein FJM51_19780 [Amaricoccus solimangrovi]
MTDLRRDALSLVGVTLGIGAIVLLVRFLGFGHGPVAGATPAAGLALAAGLRHGGAGALAVAAGFLLAQTLIGLPPASALTIALAHGLAAWIAGAALRRVRPRRPGRSHTGDLFVLLGGAGIFVLVTGLVIAASAGLGFVPLDRPAPFLAVIGLFLPLGIVTAFPVISHAGEWRAVAEDPWPAIRMALVGALLVAVLALVLRETDPGFTAGTALVLSMPFCLWVAIQPRTLDGALVGLLAAHAVLYLVLRDAGTSVLDPAYLLTTLYLNLLIVTAQFVHAVNRDRLDALAEVAARGAELEARVEQRTAKLAEMTGQARAADAAKTRLLATVSHEVRTPLNGVIGMASVVLAGPLDPGTRANVEIIRRSGFHLLDVINRILDYSRLEDAAEAEIEDFDLRALIEEVIEEARFLPFAGGLRLDLDMAGARAPRRGQRQGLRQVLTNLVGNALKFTEDGGVLVRVRETAPGHTRIEVEDTGPGVPEDLRERIFRPYEQGDAGAVRRHGGSGLGLAISSEIVARMGGRIGLDGVAGLGSRFWIELPLPPAETAPPAPGALRA